VPATYATRHQLRKNRKEGTQPSIFIPWPYHWDPLSLRYLSFSLEIKKYNSFERTKKFHSLSKYQQILLKPFSTKNFIIDKAI